MRAIDRHRMLAATLGAGFVLLASVAQSQAQQPNEMSHPSLSLTNVSSWFGLVELPFLFLAVYFAFRTAKALQGGIFGRGMTLMAWGFLVMGIGHMHMQVEHFYQYNFFAHLFGRTGGALVWVAALITTWALSGVGFYSIYRASRAR